MAATWRSTRADDGVELAWREQGAGRAVVLVHGWMLSGALWDGVIARLDGYRLVVPDLRGTGRSGRPDTGFTVARYVADLRAVVEAAGLDRFVLMGHSMGGLLAQVLASGLADRLDGLALICPVPVTGMALPPDAHGLFFGSAGSRQLQGAILDAASIELSPAERERLLDDASSLSQACIQEAYTAWTGGAEVELGGVHAPALVLATDDPFLPPAFLAQAVVARLPRARLVVLPGPGHYPMSERPQATAAVLGAFLAGIG